MSNGYATSYMTIQVTNMPATAELLISLATPNFYWTNDDANATNVGVSLTGSQGTAFPVLSGSFTTTIITLVVGGEASSFTLGVPISYPNGIDNPNAKGSLTINNPGNATVFMSAGGPQQQVAINSTWSVPIL